MKIHVDMLAAGISDLKSALVYFVDKELMKADEAIKINKELTIIKNVLEAYPKIVESNLDFDKPELRKFMEAKREID